ncbi:hypothetical protein NMY22_g4407 [Coprinellus aureogranulatus]|nr:hypothetical protein NMY22_g4407 [Coprinellus aureogranulatus]
MMPHPVSSLDGQALFRQPEFIAGTVNTLFFLTTAVLATQYLAGKRFKTDCVSIKMTVVTLLYVLSKRGLLPVVHADE